MWSVSILIPMNDNYLSNRLAFETNIDRTGIANCQIIVYNNGANLEIKNWSSIYLDKITYLESQSLKNNSDIINEMFDEVEKKIIVIIPEPIILPQNWLLELLKQNETIYNTGITSIALDSVKGNLTSKLNTFDENVFVYQPNNNQVYGVFCFNANFLNILGGFDNTLHSGFEYFDYSYRMSCLSYANYYISGISGTQIKEYEPISLLNTTQSEFENHCKNVYLKKLLQVSFRAESQKIKFAYSQIDELTTNLTSNNKHTFYKQISNAMGLEINHIDNKEITYLEQFSKKYDLKYVIKARREIKGVSINFYENE
jgi:hypothetical protein